MNRAIPNLFSRNASLAAVRDASHLHQQPANGKRTNPNRASVDLLDSSVIGRLSLLSAALYLLLTLLVFLATSLSAAEISTEEQSKLIYLLKQDCGSCHGLTLKGGLGPALLKENLAGKPKAYIATVIAQGRPGTAMPPWKDILAPQQIDFLADYLLSPENTIADKVEHATDDKLTPISK